MNEKINKNNSKIELSSFDDIFGPNFDNNSNNKGLIEDYNLKDLQAKKNIYISRILTKKEIENLNYLNDEAVIILNDNSFANVIEITKKLNKLGRQNKIIINLFNKEKINKNLLYGIRSNNVYINVSNEPLLTIKEYLRLEKKLSLMIEKAKNLSPFEKYIYAYNKTKKYKQYKDNTEDKNASRSLYRILENDFIVCTGFSKLFGDLLNKLDIRSVYISAEIDPLYQKIVSDKLIDKHNQENNHSRRYVYIKDAKYKIDGFYIADPTWDNEIPTNPAWNKDLTEDYYNHLALTNREVAMSIRRHKLDNTNNFTEYLFNVTSIEEFYNKIKWILNRKKQFNISNTNSLNDLISQLIMYYIEPLDPVFVRRLQKKYYFENEYYLKENLQEVLYIIGTYIVERVNKEISGETIMEAIENVYKKAYGQTDADWADEYGIIIEENKIRQEELYPMKYQINKNGVEELVINMENKFDFNTNKGRNRE